MARKSKRSNADDPPLDDPRWVSLTIAHHIRSEQLTRARFSSRASSHLKEGLKRGKIRCMRESKTDSSQRERVPASFWHGLEIYADADLKSIGIHRGLPNQGNAPDLRTQVYDWAIYVWRPDIDKLWPPAEARQQVEQPMRRTPGRKPTENWQAFVSGALAVFLQEGRQVPPAADFAQLCENELGYQPDIREIQKLIRKRLG